MASPSRFNSSSLVQHLFALQPPGAAVAQPQPSLAEALSHWLGWADAIELSRALAAGPGSTGHPASVDASATAAASPAQRNAAQALHASCQQVRKKLVDAIEADVAALGPAADDSLRRSLCHSLQRTMETRLAPLRARVRKEVAQRSPALAQLAALDQALEQALAGRERQLLGSVPELLSQPAKNSEAGTGTAHPNETLRRALVAELETRLQPIEGLLAALAEGPTAQDRFN